MRVRGADIRQRRTDVFDHDPDCAFARIRRGAADQVKERTAQAVNVRAQVDVAPALGLLRADVKGGPHGSAGHRQAVLLGCALRKAKVP